MIKKISETGYVKLVIQHHNFKHIFYTFVKVKKNWHLRDLQRYLRKTFYITTIRSIFDS